jgi:hypothetical protein
MDINIRLKIDAPTGWQRRVLLYVATPLALVAATAAIAHATIDTSWIGDGKPVLSSKLRENVVDLDTRLGKVEIGRTVGAAYTATGTTYTSQAESPAGVFTLTRAAAGNVHIAFPITAFGAKPPICTATAAGGIAVYANIAAATSTELQVVLVSSATQAGVDTSFAFQCIAAQ